MKKIQAIDFDLPSVLRRRLWSDEELLHSASASSIGVVKLMQSKGIITPTKVLSPSRKRVRAWTLEDVLLVNMVLGLSEFSGFSLAASVTIAEGLGRAWLMESANIPSNVPQFWSQWDALSDEQKDKVVDGGKADFRVSATAVKQVIIRDRMTISKTDDGIDEELIGFLMNPTSNKPRLLGPAEWSQPKIATSVLTLRLGMFNAGAWYFLSTDAEGLDPS